MSSSIIVGTMKMMVTASQGVIKEIIKANGKNELLTIKMKDRVAEIDKLIEKFNNQPELF